MKKKILMPLLGAVVLGMSAYAGYRTYDAYNGASESDLLLADAEALATSGEGSYEYPDGYQVIFDCGVSLGGLKKCRAKIVTCPGGGSECDTRKCPVHR